MELNDQDYTVAVNTLRTIIKNLPNLHLATQNQASIPIVLRIAKKIQYGLFSATIAVKDNKICEGHHRYLASLLLRKIPVTVPGELASEHRVFQWSEFKFNPDDFDSEEDKEFYISQTALDNDIAVSAIRNILNNSLIL